MDYDRNFVLNVLNKLFKPHAGYPYIYESSCLFDHEPRSQTTRATDNIAQTTISAFSLTVILYVKAHSNSFERSWDY
jgi:predicted metal-binding protein